MKLFFSFIVLLNLLILTAAAQTPRLQWARHIGGEYSNNAYSVAVDRNGNIYTTGCFAETSDFDPNKGVFNMTAVKTSDIFISKIDRNGQFVWARQIGSSEICQAFSIAIDAENNVIVTGFFSGSTDFDPGPGKLFLSTKGSVANTCVVKLTPSGDLIWAKQFKGTRPNIGYALTTDAKNSVYITGYFQGTVDFAGDTLNTQSKDVFIAKLNSFGNCVWVKQFSGTSGTGESIALDAERNIYVSGAFSDTLDFDPGSGVHTLDAEGSTNDFFLCKLDSVGNLLWVNQWGNEESLGAGRVITDPELNVYYTGGFKGKLDFDPGSDTNYLFAPNFDTYIAKLDAAGKLLWVKQFMSGEGYVIPTTIAIDQDGSVLTGGYFSGTPDFDPGPAVTSMSISYPEVNSFICKLDTKGALKWVQQIEGKTSNVIYSLVIDLYENIYVAGSFGGTTDFDPGPGKLDISPFSGYGDIMIFRLGPGASDIGESYKQGPFSIYPNPADKSVSIHTNEAVAVSVLNISGQEIFTKTVCDNEIIDIGGFPDGEYMIKNQSTQQVIKFIKK